MGKFAATVLLMMHLVDVAAGRCERDVKDHRMVHTAYGKLLIVHSHPPPSTLSQTSHDSQSLPGADVKVYFSPIYAKV
jgi:hypothetical protein